MKQAPQDARGGVPSSRKHEEVILSKVHGHSISWPSSHPGFEKPTPHPQPDARPGPAASTGTYPP